MLVYLHICMHIYVCVCVYVLDRYIHLWLRIGLCNCGSWIRRKEKIRNVLESCWHKLKSQEYRLKFASILVVWSWWRLSCRSKCLCHSNKTSTSSWGARKTEKISGKLEESQFPQWAHRSGASCVNYKMVTSFFLPSTRISCGLP